MKKHLFYVAVLCLAAGVAACSESGEDEPVLPQGGNGTETPGPVAPDTVAAEVSILNLTWKEAVLPGQEVRLRANIIHSSHARLQWYLDGVEVSTDTLYVFSSQQEGTYRLKVTATNDLGCGSDSLDIRVMNGFRIGDITNWTGSGANEAVLAIQWVSAGTEDLLHPKDEDVFFRAWGYRWGAEPNVTGETMIRAIAKNDARLFVIVATDGWGTAIKGFGYDGNGDGKIHIRNKGYKDSEREMKPLELTEKNFSEGVYVQKFGESVEEFEVLSEGDWWMGGWYTAYPSYWLGAGEAVLVSEEYSYSQFYASGRLLEHHSWDAWTFSPINYETKENLLPIPRLLKAADK